MEKKAAKIQKERIKDIEEKAASLLEKCDILPLASINENGYPRICTLTKVKSDSFFDIYFVPSKRSKVNVKTSHFENNPKASVFYTLGGDSVSFIGTLNLSQINLCKKVCGKNLTKNFLNREQMTQNIDY